MTDRTLPVVAIVAAAVGMGVAADQLLRAPGGPGLNVFLLFVGLAVSVWVVARTGDAPLSREAVGWIGVALLSGAALVWRGSEVLRLTAFLAACTAFALPALHGGRAWARRAGVLDVLEAVAGAVLHGAFGAVRLVREGRWDGLGSRGRDGTGPAVLRGAVGGVLLALVPMAVFGALFISADAVFADLVGGVVRFDLEVLAEHLAFTAVLSWLACGYLVGVSGGTALEPVGRIRSARPRLGVAEVATALALVDLLFLGFVAVQLRYLFGGTAWVEVTPGLTYAAYARAGFFQLVAAVGLAVPWLLLAHGLLDEDDPRSRNVFAALGGVHLLLLLAVVASAVQRMLAYQEAFGLTEQRLVATAVLAWLTLLVVWFAATVPGGRRDRFAFGGLVTLFALVGVLQLVNPAAWVARHNLDRAAELGGVDAHYLASLGSDAVPLMVARIHELPAEGGCVVAHGLIRRWGPEKPADWRSFNASDDRARDLVSADLAALGALAPRGEGEVCGASP